MLILSEYIFIGLIFLNMGYDKIRLAKNKDCRGIHDSKILMRKIDTKTPVKLRYWKHLGLKRHLCLGVKTFLNEIFFRIFEG